MKQNRRLKEKVFKVIAIINSHHTGAYAAQAAYFFVLSLIPIILLLMTLVQYTPITMTAVMDGLSQIHRDTGICAVRLGDLRYDLSGALVCRKRGAFGDFGTQLCL